MTFSALDEILISFLNSQGYSRAHAEERVKNDPASVRDEFVAAQEKSQQQG